MGHRYPSYRYEVTGEKLREYALATSFDETDAAWPQPVEPGDIAPPGFAACFTIARGLGVLLADEQLGAHASLLHGSQSYEFHRPLCRGDVLECAPWIRDIAVRAGLELITVQIDCADAVSGEPVLTSRGTLILLGGREGRADA